jgi:hypothetical protein
MIRNKKFAITLSALLVLTLFAGTLVFAGQQQGQLVPSQPGVSQISLPISTAAPCAGGNLMADCPGCPNPWG